MDQSPAKKGSDSPKSYIFVAAGFRSANEKISAKQLVQRRLQDACWPIGPSTSNKDRLREGDRAVIYLAGSSSSKSDSDVQCFVAVAEICGPTIHDGWLRADRSWLGSVAPTPDYVRLRREVWFSEPVPIKKLLPSLSFTRDKSRWGVSLQGGIVGIGNEDFGLILATAGIKA